MTTQPTKETPMPARRPAPSWKPGDFATFPDRFGRQWTGLWEGQSETYTTRFTATGEEIARKVPLVTYSMLVEPAQSPEHPGSGAHLISVDVRKLRPATPQQIAVSAVRQGLEACQRRAERASAWWVQAEPAVAYLKAAYHQAAWPVGVLLEADRFPGRYAYTADREHWVVKRMPGARWEAGPAHPADPALLAAGLARLRESAAAAGVDPPSCTYAEWRAANGLPALPAGPDTPPAVI